jgi:hypothetical protein
MADTHTGQCYCGAVEIEMRDEPLEWVTATAKAVGAIQPRR